MASLYKLPCIFVVENNLWAIGMNHNRATNPTSGDNSPFIYKKGPAFGMPGILVDGMDVRKVTMCNGLRLYDKCNCACCNLLLVGGAGNVCRWPQGNNMQFIDVFLTKQLYVL